MTNLSKADQDGIEQSLDRARKLIQSDRLDEAEQLLDVVLKSNPDEINVPFLRGTLLLKKKENENALSLFLQVHGKMPGFLGNLNNIARTYYLLKQYDNAAVYYNKYLEIEPKADSIWASLASCYYRLNDIDAAIKCFREVLRISPHMDNMASNILTAMIYAESVSPEEQAEEAQRFGKNMAKLYAEKTDFTNDKNKDRKLRIGYISPDFREHPIPYFVEPLLQHHNKEKFEIYAYSTTVTDNCVMDRIKKYVDGWRDVRGFDVDKIRNVIVNDNIDILVDLAGHTADNSLKVFAYRVAPIQVSWLGYPATTGIEAMDYRIVDFYTEPPGMSEHLSTETLWRLPHIFCVYSPHENSPPVIDHPPFEDNGYITFGCFNNFIKVRDPVLAAWSKILERVPNARLLLEIDGIEDSKFLGKVQERLKRYKIPLDRVILEPRAKANQYVLYNKIDIALDPFPCVGGTTSMDTLWMGVPLVTLAGKHFGARLGVTVLANAGLPELVTDNTEDYISTAVNLATDGERLKRIRHNLRDRFAKSPGMDALAFTRDMEEAYRGMWHKYCDRDDADYFFNRAKTYMGEGRYDDALRWFQKVLDVKPDVRAYGNMGLIYQNTGRLPEAVEYFKNALELEPASYKTLNNLGVISDRLRRYDEAIVYFKKSIEVDGSHWQTYNNLATSCKNIAQFDEAFFYYKKALGLAPKEPIPYHNILLAMVYCESVTAEEIADTARAFGKNVSDPLQRQRPFKNDKNPERKLRIGYASPDFRDHAVNCFFEYLPKLHDRKNFEIYAYSKTVQEDKITQSIKQNVDHWRDIRFINDDAAANLIESDSIDILVDTAGHTDQNCLMVMARKPAPIQVTWLGHPATSGMKAMDYRLTDAYVEPVGMAEHLNTETLWRLPEIFCCYQPLAQSPDVIDHLPFEDNGYITFGCFANFSRVSNKALTAWAQILAQIPDARLLLEIAGIDSPRFRSETERRFRECGLPLDRIILEPRKPSNRFVLYNKIDIALDPFPAVGGTTSMDALWMGVPFVTLAGKVFLERIGVSVLTNAGLSDLIADNVKEYVSKTVAIAKNHAHLKKIRHGLRDRFAISPAMDQEKFVRNIEAAYRSMWKKYCG